MTAAPSLSTELQLLHKSGEAPDIEALAERFRVAPRRVREEYDALSLLGNLHSAAAEAVRQRQDPRFWPEVTLLLGQVLDERFRIDSSLGRGEGRLTYRAWDLIAGQQVVVTALPSLAGKEQTFAEQLGLSISGLVRLHHPSTAPFLGASVYKGLPYVARGWADGVSLATRLEDGPLTREQSLGVASSLADALRFAHRLGLAHGDIRPGRVFMSEAGEVVLCGFAEPRESAASPSADVHDWAELVSATLDPGTAPSWRSLLDRCRDPDADQRPRFDELVSELEGLRASSSWPTAWSATLIGVGIAAAALVAWLLSRG